QATFIHSDLAAARKPKFYALGTLGAIVGDWNPIAEPAVADLPAILKLHRQDGTSQSVEFEKQGEFEFHKSIVDYLTIGTPMAVTALQSRNVVAIMQAAEESALNNAMPVVPKLRDRISSSSV
ncbi:MAG: hypothetical protein ACKOAQ_10615, partial [Acidimicrobiaceae bacterium]